MIAELSTRSSPAVAEQVPCSTYVPAALQMRKWVTALAWPVALRSVAVAVRAASEVVVTKAAPAYAAGAARTQVATGVAAAALALAGSLPV